MFRPVPLAAALLLIVATGCGSLHTRLQNRLSRFSPLGGAMIADSGCESGLCSASLSGGVVAGECPSCGNMVADSFPGGCDHCTAGTTLPTPTPSYILPPSYSTPVSPGGVIGQPIEAVAPGTLDTQVGLGYGGAAVSAVPSQVFPFAGYPMNGMTGAMPYEGMVYPVLGPDEKVVEPKDEKPD